MKFIITEESEQVLVEAIATEDNEKITLPDTVAFFMSGLHGMCAQMIQAADEAEIQELHDYMTGVFSLFMERVFPGRAEFGLSDAALIYAQDKIIEEAIKKGVPVEEAVAEYNAMADKYYKDLKNAGKMS